ncbi:MAG: hypothetical protein J0H91_02260 [Rhodospirillales bacterium]|nr:hypothetical protein [Rhodospirillales bacterium]
MSDTKSIDQGKSGTCGFVSVLDVLNRSGRLKHMEKGRDNMTLGEIHQRLGAEMITYLKMTEVERPTIAQGILAFTQSFGAPYSGYTSIQDICRRIKNEVLVGPRNASDWTNYQGGIGVGFPPAAVLDYLKQVGLKGEQKTVNNPAYTAQELLKHKDCIVGCGRTDHNSPYGGLRHWVYVTPDGKVCTWGNVTDLTSEGLPASLTRYGWVPAVIELK